MRPSWRENKQVREWIWGARHKGSSGEGGGSDGCDTAGSGEPWAAVWGQWEGGGWTVAGLIVKGVWVLSWGSGEPESVSEQGRSL